jgi:hypothetical protein
MSHLLVADGDGLHGGLLGIQDGQKVSRVLKAIYIKCNKVKENSVAYNVWLALSFVMVT